MTYFNQDELEQGDQGYREPVRDEVQYLSIRAYSSHQEVKEAANILVGEFTRTRQRLRGVSKYEKDAKKLIASIWLHKNIFRFTTKKIYFTRGKRKQVWMTNRTLDLFNCARKLGWVEEVRGAIPPYLAKGDKGLSTIYVATESFNKLLTHLSNQDITNNPDMPCVLRKDKNKNVIEEPPEFYQTSKYRLLESLLERHLKRLLAHKIAWQWSESITAPDLLLTHQFTEDFSHGGRFYCNFQNKPKAQRNKVTIDGKPVGSLDITQCHPMLILRIFKGKESEDGLFTQFNEDVYQVPGFESLHRDIRKKAVNTLFNAESLEAAVKSLRNTHWWIDGFTDEIVITTYKSSQKRHGKKIFESTQQINQFIENFKICHPLFADTIGSGIGLKLQGYDGNITHNMLRLADKINIPIVPIHEEYLCKEEDKAKIIEMLRGALKVTLDSYISSGIVHAKWTDSSGNKEKISITL